MSEDIQRTLGRIESKIDGITENLYKMERRVERGEDRMTAQEQKLANALGWATGAGAVSALVVSVLMGVLRFLLG